MPSTTLVGGLAVVVVILLAIVVARLRRKPAEITAAPPRELADPANLGANLGANLEKSASLAPPPASFAPPKSASLPPPPASLAPPSLAPAVVSSPPPALSEPPKAGEFPLPPGPLAAADERPHTPPQVSEPPEALDDAEIEAAPDVEVADEEPLSQTPTTPPSAEPAAASSARGPRPPMPSYSSISDESVAEEVRLSKAPTALEAEASEPKPAVVSAPKPAPRPVAPAPTFSKLAEPKPAAPAAPKPGAFAPKAPLSEPKTSVTAPKAPVPSEPKLTPLGATSKVPAASPAATPAPAAAAPAPAAAAEHDFSALNEPAPAAKPVPAAAARFLPPSNPATAELEKNDPRHAAARRLARLSVSEIKLYHEAEVTEGREAKDLWKRLGKDILLAKQTFEGRVVQEVRDRFDYLYDEILRQLAEGDVAKLGPDAPPPPKNEAAAAPPPASAQPVASVASAAPVTAPADADFDAPTRTVRRTLEPSPPAGEVAPAEPVKAEPPPAASAPVTAPAPTAPAPTAPAPTAPAAAAKPTGLAARVIASNPETAELEKNDPRHAAARRLARLSVSEIKLYHEDEVKAGREAKDLWKRMITDIGLATQTFEKRVDKEVRERFDYLYDEILRQLAEGDASKLGPDAPKPKSGAVPAAPASAPAAAASSPAVSAAPPKPASSEPKVAAPPVAKAPASSPSVSAVPKAPASSPSVSAAPKAAPSEPKPAPAPAAAPVATSVASRFLPPSNPATAELEKSDPRHAAARRLARLSVSEIKLYHEDEVKAGREANDLWKRLITDIGLATQTYEKRVDKEVRERFDYLYDEILRQLAEGDAAKLGTDAPKPKMDAS